MKQTLIILLTVVAMSAKGQEPTFTIDSTFTIEAGDTGKVYFIRQDRLFKYMPLTSPAEYTDTVKNNMLISIGTNVSIMQGYAVRNCTPYRYYSGSFSDSITTDTSYTLLYYLDADKKPLSKNIKVWICNQP